ncbi:MAG: hypothetical protein ACRC9X_05150 [Bacteroidales bacterium]
MAKRIVLSDESVNSYGFWVKTDGIDLTQFKRNPIMLWNHNRSYTDSTNTQLPIGKWSNIEVKDGVLSAEPVFDLQDKFAAEIARKYEQGILSMASIGIAKIESTDATEFRKERQTRPAVIGCKLREVSIVDIGSNDNAVVLYDDQGDVLELSDKGDCPLALIDNKNQNKKSMKEITLALGLDSSAQEADAVGAVNALKIRAEKAEADLKLMQDKQAEEAQKRIASLVDTAIAEGKITADKKDVFLSIGKTSGEQALVGALSAIDTPTKASDILRRATGGSASTDKKFAELSDDARLALRSNEPEAYAKLFEAEYGFKPVL